MPPSLSAASFMDCSTPGRSRTCDKILQVGLGVRAAWMPSCGMLLIRSLPLPHQPTVAIAPLPPPHIHFQGERLPAQLAHALGHTFQLLLIANVCRLRKAQQLATNLSQFEGLGGGAGVRRSSSGSGIAGPAQCSNRARRRRLLPLSQRRSSKAAARPTTAHPPAPHQHRSVPCPQQSRIPCLRVAQARWRECSQGCLPSYQLPQAGGWPLNRPCQSPALAHPAPRPSHMPSCRSDQTAC